MTQLSRLFRRRSMTSYLPLSIRNARCWRLRRTETWLALLRGTREEAQDAVRKFDYLTENFQGNLISELSVSKGVVVCSEHIELNFEEIKAMADKLMYADKDEYYRRTGKDRR